MSYTDAIASLLGDWASSLTPGAVLLRLALSGILAAGIGCERSSKRHAAGLRTFMLISLGSTAAMLLDLLLAGEEKPLYLLSAAVIIGVSTVCVNTVLYTSRSQIKGLTTSSALWAGSILGLTVGAGFYTVALILFAALYVTLDFFPRFEKYLKDRSNHFEVLLELKNSIYLQDFAATIRKLGLFIDEIESNPAYAGSGLSVYSVAISISSEELKKYKTHKEIIEALRSLEYISHIEEMDS